MHAWTHARPHRALFKTATITHMLLNPERSTYIWTWNFTHEKNGMGNEFRVRFDTLFIGSHCVRMRFYGVLYLYKYLATSTGQWFRFFSTFITDSFSVNLKVFSFTVIVHQNNRHTQSLRFEEYLYEAMKIMEKYIILKFEEWNFKVKLFFRSKM